MPSWFDQSHTALKYIHIHIGYYIINLEEYYVFFNFKRQVIQQKFLVSILPPPLQLLKKKTPQFLRGFITEKVTGLVYLFVNKNYRCNCALVFLKINLSQ